MVSSEELTLLEGSSIPKTFRELLAEVMELHKGQVKEKYRRGLEAVGLCLTPSYELGSLTPELATTLLSNLMCTQPDTSLSCVEHAYARVLAAIDRHIAVDSSFYTNFQSAENAAEEKKQQYRVSLSELFAVVRPLADSIVANKSYEEVGLQHRYAAGEVAVQFFSLASDAMRVIVPKGTDAALVALIVEKSKKAWKEIRQPSPNKRQVFTVVYTADARVRPYALTKTNPFSVLSPYLPNIGSVAVHEAIHAVFGAEVGAVLNMDIVEGMATRLAKEIDPEDSSNNIQTLLRIWRRIGLPHIVNQGVVGSHTHLLAVNNPRSGQVHNSNEASYVFGYCLTEALMTSDHTKQAMAESKALGLSPYTIFIELNRALSVESIDLSSILEPSARWTLKPGANRRMIDYALR